MNPDDLDDIALELDALTAAHDDGMVPEGELHAVEAVKQGPGCYRLRHMESGEYLSGLVILSN